MKIIGSQALVYVNKALKKKKQPKHAHSFMYCLWLFLHYQNRFE